MGSGRNGFLYLNKVKKSRVLVRLFLKPLSNNTIDRIVVKIDKNILEKEKKSQLNTLNRMS